MQIGGIVLCGGRSSRMGQPKCWLPIGEEFMLQRIVRLVGSVVAPVVVVAAEGQEIPDLPTDVRVVRDEEEYLGPLAGIGIGLQAIAELCELAFVTSCDVPLMKPELIREMIRRVETFDLAVPREGEFHHPLAGVYRTSLIDRISRLVADKRLRPLFLIQESNSCEVPVSELRGVDPELQSLLNINRPDDYKSALRLAGFANQISELE